MRAVSVTKFGGPEVLEVVEIPEAAAGPGEVVVDVDAAEVLFLDTQLRAGWGREYFAMEPPFVPGAGVAGVVSAVGDGAAPKLIGQRVIAGTGVVGTYPGGGYAERVAVPETEVFPIPDGVEPATGLAALHDGATALSQLDRAAVVAGERVLITAAAGSLGSWLVPLLVSAGVTVVGAARGSAKLAHVRALGADETVDYSLPDWSDQVGQVDVVFDGAGGAIGRSAYLITKPGGRFLGYGAASGEFAAPAEDREVTVLGIFQPDPADWREWPRRALRHLADGTVSPTIGGRFALADAAAAHGAVESRTTLGKTVLHR